MTKAQLETAVRNQFLEAVKELVSNRFETDALPVSASEIAVPCLDPDGNETWAVIKVSIPRGTRNGEGGYDPYDGYFAAEEYQEDLKEKAEKKAAAEAKKQAKIAKDQKAREEKKALAEANKNLKELRKIDITPKGE